MGSATRRVALQKSFPHLGVDQGLGFLAVGHIEDSAQGLPPHVAHAPVGDGIGMGLENRVFQPGERGMVSSMGSAV